MTENWKARWEEGRIGWHEVSGNTALHKYWPTSGNGERVLVPLCGKSPDLLWLAQQGCNVTGIELSEIAVRKFFDEADLQFDLSRTGNFMLFECHELAITLVCGDYFEYSNEPFSALYDRASLIALPPQSRPKYASHTQSLLAANAQQLLITLEYDQSKANGPPFAVLADEVSGYWKNLRRVEEHNAIDNTPPKFKEAGLTEVTEVVWLS